MKLKLSKIDKIYLDDKTIKITSCEICGKRMGYVNDDPYLGAEVYCPKCINKIINSNLSTVFIPPPKFDGPFYFTREEIEIISDKYIETIKNNNNDKC
jgi:hypothetical protein